MIQGLSLTTQMFILSFVNRGFVPGNGQAPHLWWASIKWHRGFWLLGVPLPEVELILNPEPLTLWKQAARQVEGFHANNLLNGGLYTGKPYCGN